MTILNPDSLARVVRASATAGAEEINIRVIELQKARRISTRAGFGRDGMSRKAWKVEAVFEGEEA